MGKAAGGRLAVPRVRSGAISRAAWFAGLPWRLRPARGKFLSPADPNLRRVVVIKPCCMGDVLMATPAIAALHRALPNASIAVAVGPYSRPALLNNPRITETIQTATGTGKSIPADYIRLARLIRKGRFGTALVLDRSPLLNMVPYLAGVPVRAGLDSDNRGLALTHPVECPPGQARHEVEWYLDVVRALGLPAPREGAHLEFYPTTEEDTEAQKALSMAGGEWGEEEDGSVALHIGGGSNPGMNLPSKRWKPERWARIADWLAETYEPTILLLGGPGEEDRTAADALLSALFPATRPYVLDLVGKLGWGAMGALLQKCNLFLGHDTGAMHLATAVRAPVVAVFGPTDPVRFGPWDPSRRSVVVAPRQTHRASDAEALRRAAKQGELYNSSVQAESVWAAIEKMYAHTRRRGRARG